MRLIDVFYSEIQFVKLNPHLPAENFTVSRVFVRKSTIIKQEILPAT
jgi:hypothetical protein